MPVEEIETQVVEVHVHGGVEEYDIVNREGKPDALPIYPIPRSALVLLEAVDEVCIGSFREKERMLKGLI